MVNRSGRMVRIVLGAGLVHLLSACDPAEPDGNERVANSPMATIYGQAFFRLDDSQQVPGMNVAFGWHDFGKAEPCIAAANGEQAAFVECMENVGFPTIEWETVPIKSGQEATFEIPILAAPTDQQLLGEGENAFGWGPLVLYQDGNGNRRVDPVELEATSSIDTLYAMSDDLILYRRGNFQPVLASLSAIGCPEIPQGFSVLSIKGDPDVDYSSCGTNGQACPECTISPVQEKRIPLYVTDTSKAQVRELICADLNLSLTDVRPQEPPANLDLAACDPEDDSYFYYNPHPERYCFISNARRYTLVGENNGDSWNLLDQRPDWWPCPMEVD